MKHVLLLALFAAPAALLTAQTETIIERAQQPAPPRAPAESGAAAVAPRDADAGTQRIAEPRKFPVKLSVAYDAQVYHTSNVNLVPSDTPQDEAVIIANTLALRAELKSWAAGDGIFTPSIGFNVQRFYHGVGSNDHKNLDFDSYSAPLTLRYRFGSNWEAAVALTGTSIYSLEGPPEYHRIFRSYAPSLSLRKLIGIRENQILSVGAGASYSVTKGDPDTAIFFREDRNDKSDFSADIAYYYLRGKWVAGPYARLAFSDYAHYQEGGFVDVDRRDVTGSVGLSISYNLTSWASARVFTSYDWRNPQGPSTTDYSYTTTNAGLGLTLSASF